MFAHFVTGCDTTSAVLVKGKVKALDNISSNKDWSCLEVLRQPQSTHGDIRTAGGYFMFKLYDYISAQSLNKQTHNVQPEPWLSIPDLFIYDRNSASSSAAAKFHLYQTYHSVQQRLAMTCPQLTEVGGLEVTHWAYSAGTNPVRKNNLRLRLRFHVVRFPDEYVIVTWFDRKLTKWMDLHHGL